MDISLKIVHAETTKHRPVQMNTAIEEELHERISIAIFHNVTREHFEALARNAERAMNVSLPWYRMKVTLLALLGYVVIFGILAVLLTILALCVWAVLSGYAWVLLLKAKLVLAFPVLGLVLLRALWVRIEAPKGIPGLPKGLSSAF